MLPPDPGPAETWEYVAEGNLNVVLRYRGPEDALRGQVIRLRKQLREYSATHVSREYQAWWAVARKRLLAGLPTAPETPFPLPPRSVRAFQRQLSHMTTRPRKRWGHDLDLTGAGASIMPDLTRLSETVARLAPPLLPPGTLQPAALCVEIKPKAGVQQVAAGDDAKLRACRYCMHQVLKRRSGSVEGVAGDPSAYCPLALYAKSPAKVGAAVRALLASPQNNLRLFLGGRPVDGAAIGPTLRARGVSPALLSRVVAAALQSSRVLRQLRALQRLDDVGVEVIGGLCRALRGVGLLHRVSRDAGPWVAAASATVAGAAGDESPAIGRCAPPPRDAGLLRRVAESGFSAPGGVEAEVAAAVRAVQRFLVATSAKDGSVMLAVQECVAPPPRPPPPPLPQSTARPRPPGPGTVCRVATVPGAAQRAGAAPDRNRDAQGTGPWGGIVHDAETGRVFACSLAVVDIDYKSPEKVPHYVRLDREIVAAFLSAPPGSVAACRLAAKHRRALAIRRDVDGNTSDEGREQPAP